MKVAALFASLFSASLAAECVRYGGCAGCANVASISFTQDGDTYTATSSSYGTVIINSDTISVKNTASKWILFCVYSAACFPLEAGDECTTARGANDNPSFVQIWSH